MKKLLVAAAAAGLCVSASALNVWDSNGGLLGDFELHDHTASFTQFNYSSPGESLEIFNFTSPTYTEDGDGYVMRSGNNWAVFYESCHNPICSSPIIYFSHGTGDQGVLHVSGPNGPGNDFAIGAFEVGVVPEPAEITLILAGLATIGFASRRKPR
jgi:hypothetical protein